MNIQSINLAKYTKKHSAQPGCTNWSWQLCTWKTSNVQPKCQGPVLLHRKTDADKRKRLGRLKIESSYFDTYIERGKY